MEKAYKLLALQEEISNKKAKELIDNGVVYIENIKVKVARAEYIEQTKFNIQNFGKIEKVFEDDNIIVLNKPPFINSEDLLKKFKHTKLLHRLDKDTSGVIILTKDEDFRISAIKEFAQNRVYKEYVAVVHGKVVEEFDIDKPIMTIKGSSAKSIVSKKGKSALTQITPLELHGKKSKIKVVIQSGRTHQIRVHLAYVDFPVVGDRLYGINSSAKRLLLHSKKIELFDYKFEIEEGDEFRKIFT